MKLVWRGVRDERIVFSITFFFLPPPTPFFYLQFSACCSIRNRSVIFAASVQTRRMVILKARNYHVFFFLILHAQRLKRKVAVYMQLCKSRQHDSPERLSWRGCRREIILLPLKTSFKVPSFAKEQTSNAFLLIEGDKRRQLLSCRFLDASRRRKKNEEFIWHGSGASKNKNAVIWYCCWSPPPPFRPVWTTAVNFCVKSN